MKILLLALNAKYIHSNPAVYSLKACAEQRGFQAGLLEFTINQKDDEILRALYRERPDVLAVSVYIWNIQTVRRLLRDYRSIRPETEIWLADRRCRMTAGLCWNRLRLRTALCGAREKKHFQSSAPSGTTAAAKATTGNLRCPQGTGKQQTETENWKKFPASPGGRREEP